jgi:NAD(P)H dehydrogenase (quinone)
MRKVAVVFHSICGNTMLMAKQYEEAFLDEGMAVSVFRVEDATYSEKSGLYGAAKDAWQDMLQIPVIKDPLELEGYSAFVVGAPTYYGSLSAQMKAFLDKFPPPDEAGPFYGKYFLSFATGENSAGGALFCLQTLNLFAVHQGMLVVPVPPKTGAMPAYGCVHYSGYQAANRPNQALLMAIRKHAYAAAGAIGD